MLAIYLITTMADHKHDLCFYKVELPSRGNRLNILW
jgi:hypothetical protein